MLSRFIAPTLVTLGRLPQMACELISFYWSLEVEFVSWRYYLVIWVLSNTWFVALLLTPEKSGVRLRTWQKWLRTAP